VVHDGGLGRGGLDGCCGEVSSGSAASPLTVGSVPQCIRCLLAGNVRRERERAQLSQEALAEACNLQRSTVARIERAEREPRITTLVAFSVALEIPLSALLAGLLEGRDLQIGE
jgi:DNA-binding XRE family transcriptional regulator